MLLQYSKELKTKNNLNNESFYSKEYLLELGQQMLIGNKCFRNMYNYSVIIPYRDKYEMLVIAVDSIPDRNDIQIIIVDNSTICLPKDKVPQKKKAKVVYTTSSPSRGAGCARNEGLSHVEGRYLLFLDADDYFTSEAFEAFDRYIDSEFDIVFFKSNSVFLNNGLQSNRHKVINQLIDTYQKTWNGDILRYRFVNPIAKMMSSDFVKREGFLFDELIVSNDVWFSVMSGHKAKMITVDNAEVYMITEGSKGSSLTTNRTKENWFIRYQVMIRVNKFLKSVGKYKYRIRLIGALRIAWRDFGFKEFIHFLKYAYENKVGVF